MYITERYALVIERDLQDDHPKLSIIVYFIVHPGKRYI